MTGMRSPGDLSDLLLRDCQIPQVRIWQSEPSRGGRPDQGLGRRPAPAGLPNPAGSDLAIRTEQGRVARSGIGAEACSCGIAKSRRFGFGNPNRAGEGGPIRGWGKCLLLWDCQIPQAFPCNI